MPTAELQDEPAVKRARAIIDRRLANYRLGIAPSVTSTSIGIAAAGLGTSQGELFLVIAGGALTLAGVSLVLLFIDRVKGYTSALDSLDSVDLPAISGARDTKAALPASER